MKLPELKDVDTSRAFTPEEQELVNGLTREQRLEYMRRPNSKEKMTLAERNAHYKGSNYPEVKYGPGWTLTPPKRAK